MEAEAQIRPSSLSPHRIRREARRRVCWRRAIGMRRARESRTGAFRCGVARHSRFSLANRAPVAARPADRLAIFRQPLAQQFLHAPTSLRLALVHGQWALIPALLALARTHLASLYPPFPF